MASHQIFCSESGSITTYHSHQIIILFAIIWKYLFFLSISSKICLASWLNKNNSLGLVLLLPHKMIMMKKLAKYASCGYVFPRLIWRLSNLKFTGYLCGHAKLNRQDSHFGEPNNSHYHRFFHRLLVNKWKTEEANMKVLVNFCWSKFSFEVKILLNSSHWTLRF